MQGTEAFKETIKSYLENRAEQDNLFAQNYQKENKSIDYFDEDDLGDIKSSQCRIVVNHAIELTEEEKAEARQNAIKRLEEETYQSMRKPAKKPQISATKETIEQGSLF